MGGARLGLLTSTQGGAGTGERIGGVTPACHNFVTAPKNFGVTGRYRAIPYVIVPKRVIL